MLTSQWRHKSRGAVSQQRHKATRAAPLFTLSLSSSFFHHLVAQVVGTTGEILHDANAIKSPAER